MMATLMSSFSCAIVASSAIVIWKPPSPTTTQTSASGQRDLGADRRRQREAHRAEAAGGDERPRRVVLVVLRLPHLVLADVGDDDRVAVGQAPEVVDHVRGVEMPVVGQVLNVADGRVALRARRCGVSHADAVAALDERQPVVERRPAGRRRSPTSTRTFLLSSARSMST